VQGPRRGITSECPSSETQTPGARNHDQTAALGHSQLMSSAKITRREIDWHTASVKDGTLTVKLTGAASKRWSEHFGAVVALLGAPHGAWQDTAVRKAGIEVKGVGEGAEEDVRHFLESVVLQVNVELRPEDSAMEQAPSNAEENDQQAVDRKMSETFHAFADSDGANGREDAGRQSG
jgi:hypothetical protein